MERWVEKKGGFARRALGGTKVWGGRGGKSAGGGGRLNPRPSGVGIPMVVGRRRPDDHYDWPVK